MGSDEDTFTRQRHALIDTLVERRVIADSRVAEALRRVPRHRFLPAKAHGVAYQDAPVLIGEGQTMSAPHMVAIMLEALQLEPGQRVLEIGTGSGYHAALLAELVRPTGRVDTVERVPRLAEAATAALQQTGYADVHVHLADGTLGLSARAPFDRIHVAAASPHVPQALLDQLAPGGILLVPVGTADLQDLLRVRRDAHGNLATESLGPVLFVPLLGEHGFPEA